ncbi:MAG: dipeptidase [Pseudomonadota bacterium]
MNSVSRSLRHQPKVTLLSWALIATSLLVTTALAQSEVTDPYETQAQSLHQQMLSIDAHVDIPPNFATEKADPGTETRGQIDLPKMDRGGLSGAVFAVFVSQDVRSAENYQRAKQDAQTKLDAIWRMAEQYPDRIGVATSPEKVKELHDSGRHFAVVGMLNGFPLGPEAEELDAYFERGLRQLAFNHAGHNALADSSRPRDRYGDAPAEHGGLSDLGKSVVRRMNQLGIIVDVSQLTPAGVQQAVAVSETPVIASHSAVASLLEHPRNLSDADMKLIADKGGVVCIVAFGGYLIDVGMDFNAEMEKVQARFGVAEESEVAALPEAQKKAYQGEILSLLRRLPKASVAQYVDAIDYAVKLVGVDHVGIGTDFNHGGGLKEFKNAGDSYQVTAELLRRGYTEDDIRKIWGGNWLRVFSEVTHHARGGVKDSG